MTSDELAAAISALSQTQIQIQIGIGVVTTALISWLISIVKTQQAAINSLKKNVDAMKAISDTVLTQWDPSKIEALTRAETSIAVDKTKTELMKKYADSIRESKEESIRDIESQQQFYESREKGLLSLAIGGVMRAGSFIQSAKNVERAIESILELKNRSDAPPEVLEEESELIYIADGMAATLEHYVLPRAQERERNQLKRLGLLPKDES